MVTFGGGNPSTSIMDKVTYASDTTAAVPGANLSWHVSALAASSAGANGLPNSPYLADAPSSPAIRFSDGAAPTPNTGYFGGGDTSPINNG